MVKGERIDSLWCNWPRYFAVGKLERDRENSSLYYWDVSP